MIACVICGGIGEYWLLTVGLGGLIAWLKKRHDKKKCKCCQGHEQAGKNNDVVVNGDE